MSAPPKLINMIGQFHTTFFQSILSQTCLTVFWDAPSKAFWKFSWAIQLFSWIIILLFLGAVRRFITFCVQHDVSLASPVFFQYLVFVDLFSLCYIVVWIIILHCIASVSSCFVFCIVILILLYLCIHLSIFFALFIKLLFLHLLYYRY